MSVDFEYDHECSRAELLGLPRPGRDEFLARKVEVSEDGVEAETNDITTEEIEHIDLQGETINRTTGGLDELNNILSITQKKINRFKTVCGSFTNLLKIKVGVKGEDSDTCSTNSVDPPTVTDEETAPREGHGTHTQGLRSSDTKDINAQMGSQIDKLDSLIMKAERAELSLNSQNKQMKHFLNK